MSVSYPSKILTVLDVPEVRKFNASFEYNFFTKDEKTNGQGYKPVQGIVDPENEISISRKVPRYVKFSFETVDSVSNAKVSDEFALSINKQENVKRILKRNLRKIQNETSVATKGYTSLNLQDRLIDKKTSRILKLATIMRSQSASGGKKRNLPESRADLAKLLNDLTSKSISGNWLMKVTSSQWTTGVYYYRTRSRRFKRSKARWTRKLSNVSLYSQFNNIKIYQII